jgi:hypothetical protein
MIKHALQPSCRIATLALALLHDSNQRSWAITIHRLACRELRGPWPSLRTRGHLWTSLCDLLISSHGRHSLVTKAVQSCLGHASLLCNMRKRAESNYEVRKHHRHLPMISHVINLWMPARCSSDIFDTLRICPVSLPSCLNIVRIGWMGHSQPNL